MSLRKAEDETTTSLRDLRSPKIEKTTMSCGTTTDVAIGETMMEMDHFGTGYAVRQGHYYRLIFPDGMTLSAKEFNRHMLAVDNGQPVHKVWARFQLQGEPILLYAVMTSLAHDEIHLCGWGEDAED